MKVIVLLWLALCTACAQFEKHPEGEPESKIGINLSTIESRKGVKSLGENQFLVLSEKNSEIKILRYDFKDQAGLLTYLFNRRMLLHRDFQNNIAPYVGMLETDKTCIAKVDSKGEIQERDQQTSFMTMRFPITSTFVISECLHNDVWGVLIYQFYDCKKTNQLFEVRYRHSLELLDKELIISCGENP